MILKERGVQVKQPCKLSERFWCCKLRFVGMVGVFMLFYTCCVRKAVGAWGECTVKSLLTSGFRGAGCVAKSETNDV